MGNTSQHYNAWRRVSAAIELTSKQWQVHLLLDKSKKYPLPPIWRNIIAEKQPCFTWCMLRIVTYRRGECVVWCVNSKKKSTEVTLKGLFNPVGCYRQSSKKLMQEQHFLFRAPFFFLPPLTILCLLPLSLLPQTTHYRPPLHSQIHLKPTLDSYYLCFFWREVGGGLLTMTSPVCKHSLFSDRSLPTQ